MSRLSTRLSDRACALGGWWLFVASALFFAVASLRAGDTIGLVGALCFLAADVMFLIPHYRRPAGPRDED